jgi:hypothetical protein
MAVERGEKVNDYSGTIVSERRRWRTHTLGPITPLIMANTLAPLSHALRSDNNGHLRLPCSPDCARTSLGPTCFVDFQLFRSSSSEVVFLEGCLPDLLFFLNCCRLNWTIPTNVTKHVLLISSSLCHLPVRSVFHGGRLPGFLNFENCFGLSYNCITNVRKQCF